MKISSSICLIILGSSHASASETLIEDGPPQAPNVPRWPPARPPPDGAKLIQSIVGGVPVEPKDRYPYQVALTRYSFGDQYCGGSLIAPRWVLSAAHCANAGNYVQIGRYDLTDSGEDYDNIEVLEEILHPQYNEFTFEYDFMLLRLKSDSKYPPVSIDNGSQNLPNGADVTVIGWGAIRFEGPGSQDELREVVVDIVRNTSCNSMYGGGILDSMICAARDGKDACQGDSGGPLIIRDDSDNSGDGDVVVGVVSWGYGCASPDYPGVYARISEAYEWISDNAGLNPTPPTPPTPTPPTPTPPPVTPTPPTPTPPPVTPTFNDDSFGGDDNFQYDDDFFTKCQDEEMFLDKVKKGKVVLEECASLLEMNVNDFFKYCTEKWRYKLDKSTGVVYKPPHEACARTCHFCYACNEEKKFKFYYKKNKKGTKSVLKNCKWLSKQKSKKRKGICSKGKADGVYPSADIICPRTCEIDACDANYYY